MLFRVVIARETRHPQTKGLETDRPKPPHRLHLPHITEAEKTVSRLRAQDTPS